MSNIENMSLGGVFNSSGRSGDRTVHPSSDVPASLMRRCASTVVDLAIAAVVVAGPLVALDRILTALSVADGQATPIWRAAAAVWVLGFVLLYSPLGVARWGATPGKKLLGTQVVRDSDGGRLGYGRAVVRHVCNLAMCLATVLAIANLSAINLSDRKQGLHDKLVGSLVVTKRHG
ncbi:RDD family protein [Streptomyces sp. NPDC052052]|uniref:RDD family protein n=1 Tax=Streptomyces sp. NPDC052052 TaxID=3154756 RepID=UPI00342754F4